MMETGIAPGGRVKVTLGRTLWNVRDVKAGAYVVNSCGDAACLMREFVTGSMNVVHVCCSGRGVSHLPKGVRR